LTSTRTNAVAPQQCGMHVILLLSQSVIVYIAWHTDIRQFMVWLVWGVTFLFMFVSSLSLFI